MYPSFTEGFSFPRLRSNLVWDELLTVSPAWRSIEFLPGAFVIDSVAQYESAEKNGKIALGHRDRLFSSYDLPGLCRVMRCKCRCNDAVDYRFAVREAMSHLSKAHMKKITFLIAGVILSASALAQQQAPAMAPTMAKAATGFYLGAEGGIASAKMQSDTSNTGALRLSAGYRLTPNWAFELGYLRSGDFSETTVRGSTRVEEKASLSGVDLSALYRFTDVVPGLFLKAGLMQSTLRNDWVTTRAGVRTSGSSTRSGSGYLFGVGYEYDFSANWSGNVSYTRLQKVGDSDAGVNMFSAGVKYHF